MEENNMEPMKEGERIAFIKNTDARKWICYFLGYGIYLGKFLPTKDDIKNISKIKTRSIAKKIKDPICKFKMDNGIVVWQFDGWFMSEDRFNKVFINDCYDEGWKVVDISKGIKK